MHDTLEIFRTASAMARHAGQRQAVVARNIANADTPGYQARRMAAFRDSYSAGSDTGMRVSREGHIGGGPARVAARVEEAGTEPSPNGNSVSLEQEMLAATNASREHSRAVAVYRHAMDVLRIAIGKK